MQHTTPYAEAHIYTESEIQGAKMTMWASLDAINAEAEYRRERAVRLADLVRTGRQLRAELSENRRTRRRAESESDGDERTTPGAGGHTSPHREATLPAQRTSESDPATKQPV